MWNKREIPFHGLVLYFFVIHHALTHSEWLLVMSVVLENALIFDISLLVSLRIIHDSDF